MRDQLHNSSLNRTTKRKEKKRIRMIDKPEI